MPRLITTISLQPEDLDRITRLAGETGWSRSEVVRTAIRQLAEASTKASRPTPGTAREESLRRSDHEQGTAAA